MKHLMCLCINREGSTKYTKLKLVFSTCKLLYLRTLITHNFPVFLADLAHSSVFKEQLSEAR